MMREDVVSRLDDNADAILALCVKREMGARDALAAIALVICDLFDDPAVRPQFLGWLSMMIKAVETAEGKEK